MKSVGPPRYLPHRESLPIVNADRHPTDSSATPRLMTAVSAGSLLLVSLIVLGTGCRTPPPPPPIPAAIQEAQRLGLQATRLQDAGQWAAASAWWVRAARQFQLINDRTNLAVALHHQGTCKQALGKPKEAAEHLEQAAQLNQDLGLEETWWRNQIALVQVEAADAPELARKRLEQLNQRLPGPHDTASQALLAHETARAKLRLQQPEAALSDLAIAAARFQEAGDTFGLAAVDASRAQALEGLGRLPESEAAWRSALGIFENRGHLRGIATALAGLGNCLALQGRDIAEAERLLRTSAENFEAMGLAAEARQARKTLENVASKRTQ